MGIDLMQSVWYDICINLCAVAQLQAGNAFNKGVKIMKNKKTAGRNLFAVLFFAAIMAIAAAVNVCLYASADDGTDASATLNAANLQIYEVVLFAILGVAVILFLVFAILKYIYDAKAVNKDLRGAEQKAGMTAESDNAQNDQSVAEAAFSAEEAQILDDETVSEAEEAQIFEKENAPVAAVPDKIATDTMPDAEQAQILAKETMPDSEEAQDTDEGEDMPVVELREGQFAVRFNRSLTAKLILSEERVKQYFAETANYILSFARVRGRMSWKNMSFSAGRESIAKLSIRGKTLWLFLALNPAEFMQDKYGGEDFSQSSQYEKTPYAFRIRSDRALKWAKELVDLLAQNKGLERGVPVTEFAAADYPYDTQENLIERRLIKVYSDEELPEDAELVSMGYGTILKRVSAAEAHAMIEDSVARKLVHSAVQTSAAGGAVRKKGRRYAINIDTLSENFSAGDRVDIQVLKAKGLVPAREECIKILARGVLDKPLTVVADDFSADAVKMIVLTGGEALQG